MRFGAGESGRSQSAVRINVTPEKREEARRLREQIEVFERGGGKVERVGGTPPSPAPRGFTRDSLAKARQAERKAEHRARAERASAAKAERDRARGPTISARQIQFLRLLEASRCGCCNRTATLSEIAGSMGVAKSGIQSYVERSVKRGLLESRGTRWHRTLLLTDAGRELLAQQAAP